MPETGDKEYAGGQCAAGRCPLEADLQEVLLEFTRHKAAFGTDKMQNLDDMPVAGKRAARRKHHRQHHGGEHEDKNTDADHDSGSGHGDQPVDPGAVVVQKCLRNFGLQHILRLADALHAVAVTAVLGTVDEILSGLDADVGLHQQRLKIIPKFLGNRIINRKQARDLAE